MAKLTNNLAKNWLMRKVFNSEGSYGSVNLMRPIGCIGQIPLVISALAGASPANLYTAGAVGIAGFVVGVITDLTINTKLSNKYQAATPKDAEAALAAGAVRSVTQAQALRKLFKNNANAIEQGEARYKTLQRIWSRPLQAYLNATHDAVANALMIENAADRVTVTLGKITDSERVSKLVVVEVGPDFAKELAARTKSEQTTLQTEIKSRTAQQDAIIALAEGTGLASRKRLLAMSRSLGVLKVS